LRSRLGPVPIALVLRDAEDLPETDSPLVGTVRISDRSTLLSLAVSPELGFGEGYSHGRNEVEGDLVRSLECVYQSPGIRTRYTRLRSKFMDWTQANTHRGSKRNIHRHYDLSNDFYQRWLDQRMLYTCA
jgi:cyclopropane-fatty-acyl-phospholipid synthase